MSVRLWWKFSPNLIVPVPMMATFPPSPMVPPLSASPCRQPHQARACWPWANRLDPPPVASPPGSLLRGATEPQAFSRVRDRGTMRPMTCSSCGTATRPGARFCEECGARLDAVCPACGARVSPGKKFCADCGARVDAGARPDAEPLPAPSRARFSSEDDPRAVAPAGYTPQHLAERILKDRATLQGERKQATVFFADV